MLLPAVILNGPGFNINPVVTVQNAVVNFYDNNADNGGSPPGGEDNLVLGFTNFTGRLSPSYIGVPSVTVDTLPLDFTTTINDFSTGSLEIGVTNVTNLNAQSTSHLIMDLAAALSPEGLSGIVVNGSTDRPEPRTGYLWTGRGRSCGQRAQPHWCRYPRRIGGPFSSANHGGWGNDTLTGGNGWGTATVNNAGGVLFTSFTPGVSNGTFPARLRRWHLRDLRIHCPDTGPGNTGDNFFPEGGNDVVNIAAGEVGTLTSFQDVLSSSGSILIPSTHAYDNESTVWVGFYDVCNSGGANAGAINGGTLANRASARSMTRPSPTLSGVWRPSSTGTVQPAKLRAILPPQPARRW